MKLFEIDSEILGCVDAETGEIFDEDKFESLVMEREKKIENICLWIKELKAESEAIKAEKQALEKRQKAKENKMESLKRFMTTYLEGTAFESAKVKVGFRSSESVEVDDGVILPDEYLTFAEPKPNKTALKQALKQGKQIDGVCIVKNQNIQIS